MEHVVSETIKIFTTMLFILLIVGMVIMGKHLSDVNTFKEYVNTQIERNGGYTETVKTNVEKTNKESYNDMFFMYEPNSNTPKKTGTTSFGNIVTYEIHSNIPIPFTTSGTIRIPIAFKGQAISRIRNINPPEPENKINPDDAKWVEKGNYGTNGYFVRDSAGNGIVYALDPQQPVIAPETAVSTKSNDNLTSLRFLDKTILPKNSNYYFANNSKLTTFETKNLDTAKVTSMAGMFSGMRALTILDVSNFNTSNVTNMSSMFSGMRALTSLDVSNLDTSNVTDMNYMFANLWALTSLDVSNLDTSKVTDMDQMFYNMQTLTTLDVSKFNTSNVTNMRWMFRDMRVLTALDVSNFNTSKVTNMTYMFSNMTALKTLDVSNFDMTKVSNKSGMFDNTHAVITPKLG